MQMFLLLCTPAIFLAISRCLSWFEPTKKARLGWLVAQFRWKEGGSKEAQRKLEKRRK